MEVTGVASFVFIWADGFNKAKVEHGAVSVRSAEWAESVSWVITFVHTQIPWLTARVSRRQECITCVSGTRHQHSSFPNTKPHIFLWAWRKRWSVWNKRICSHLFLKWKLFVLTLFTAVPPQSYQTLKCVVCERFIYWNITLYNNSVQHTPFAFQTPQFSWVTKQSSPNLHCLIHSLLLTLLSPSPPPRLLSVYVWLLLLWSC